MEKYKDHHKGDRNQKAALKELEAQLGEDQAILFFDYSAKYIVQLYEGPQQIGYGQERMSMLVFIIRKLDPTYLPGRRIFRSHAVFYLSDDTKEDGFQAVQTIFLLMGWKKRCGQVASFLFLMAVAISRTVIC